MKPTLLVLAAGMGSRYGGLKQMDGLGPNGETIIDYSIYDAVQAGFGKVVYIVREYFLEQFKEAVARKYSHVKCTDASPLGANLDSYYPRPLFNGKNQQTQTRYMQSAAYMRLKNLQIGYTLPRRISEKAGMQNFRVYLSGENLLTITKLSRTMDPETAGVGQQGGTVYPLSRTYSIGVNITF